ncbi:asparagine synthase (glutamine-hydrolyzing) [Marinigracilibium pacificum]|uniref:asparagine synthase (glutamine-hydrolyzing) n=1 Tax=Marinigracilibium pacificum TaxID=2729599 RepID=A0A848IZX1_9BACT|nr:asparagine synthase (glutamine-hydrolyzing) [Marinigracilibium pacificum]NMM48688.1 asparagine synthase (glutamine-hydrolyzing) [Marinigracilibium pacificum]
MCGITGVFALNEIGRMQMIHLSNATSALAHRGPDDQGLYNDYRVALGHRRLSVIDLSNAGHQPMSDKTGRYHIVFNGEIYNYRQLRTELQQGGVEFTSDSDTEVLLQLLINKGIEALDSINGFFAFAFYDSQKEEIYLARDRFGIKPLYYHIDDDKLLFASEAKSIHNYGLEKNIDKEALSIYLQLNYIPAPHTMIEGIKKLMPGTYVKCNSNGELTFSNYYNLPTPEHFTGLSYEDAQKKLRELLEKSVEARLIADVPTGTFLSGGIDSSIITAIASKKKPDLKSFSIGFHDQPFFDETNYASATAKHLGVDHTIFSLTIDDLYSNLNDMLDSLSEPFADSSALPVYLLSKLTRDHITVALSGDGADELFAGYNKYSAFQKVLNPGIKENLALAGSSIWKYLPQSRSSKIGNTFRQLNRFAGGAKLEPKDRYWFWATFMQEKEAQSYLTSDYRGNSKHVIEELCKYIHKGSINEVLNNDLSLVLTNDMLAKVDLMSMAHALEVRVPFLDHNVVNFAQSLTVDYKINGNMKKRILQDAFKDDLPEILYNRPKKGFEVPLLPWMRGELKSRIKNEWLNPSVISDQGIFDPNAIKALTDKLFSSNPGDSHATTWALIVFQQWYKNYMISE